MLGKIPSSSIYGGLSADEYAYIHRLLTNLTYYYNNTLTATQLDFGNNMWRFIYQDMFTLNSAIESLTNNTSLTASVVNQLVGEAKFMRALDYFYLVNFYGDIPLVLSTDYTVNAALPSTSKDKVYEQIVKDLTDAQQLLSDNYLDGSLLNTSIEKLRPTKAAANAVLAR